MQTFITDPDPAVCARHLDNRRLNKQITESLQIIRASLYGTGWKNHPATKMWADHEHNLALYNLHMIEEWWERGYTSHLGSVEQVFDFMDTLPDTGWPDWWGDRLMIESHKSNLVRKAPEHYIELFGDIPNDLEYIWPVRKHTTGLSGGL